jgi:hypothetical protein
MRPVLVDHCVSLQAPASARIGHGVAAMLLALGAAALVRGAHAQDANPTPAVAAGAAPNGAPTEGSSSAAPAGAALSATVIDVGGKVQWRPTAEAAWQPANVNDVLPTGSEVRTGLRSHAALRIGPNATALIDAGTVFQLPTAVRDGDVRSEEHTSELQSHRSL